MLSPAVQDFLPFRRMIGSCTGLRGDGLDQLRVTLNGRIAVHAWIVLNRQVLHPRSDRWLHPGITDVERKGFAIKCFESVREARVGRTTHGGKMVDDFWMPGHESP